MTWAIIGVSAVAGCVLLTYFWLMRTLDRASDTANKKTQDSIQAAQAAADSKRQLEQAKIRALATKKLHYLANEETSTSIKNELIEEGKKPWPPEE